MGRDEIELMSKRELDKMRAAGRLAAELLEHLGQRVVPGVTTQELNDEAERWTVARGAKSAPLGYQGFPRSICTSVNDVVCHGIPRADQRLQEGDIINLDVTPILDGYHGDTSKTFFVGTPSAEAKDLVETTRECLRLGIAQVKPGGRIRDIGEAIQAYAEQKGYSVVRDFVGHGIGRIFHCAPQVPHYYSKEARRRMEPGMVFTIEPMINTGTWKVRVLEDEWTAVTLDGGLSAQFEHTLAVTETGVEVLTLREGEAYS